jgi:predicted nucleic acid-binding protein
VARFVIDASCIPPIFFQDEASPKADSVFEAAVRGGVVVPAIWPLEVANILRQGERRGRIAQVDLAEACRRVLLIQAEVEAMTPQGRSARCSPSPPVMA